MQPLLMLSYKASPPQTLPERDAMTARRIPATDKHPPYEDEEDDLSIEYPSSDGEPMAENDAQLTAMMDAITPLREWFDSREDIYVGGDMLMYYRINDNETRVAPDVFVVVGVDSKHKRDSWIVWREGLPPTLVMEMAAGSTWRRDMREKRDIYAEMEVTEYWRFDPSGSYFAPPLIGERLEGGEYAEMPVAAGGDGILRGHSPVLGLDLCVLPDGNLRFHDPASGQWLRTLHDAENALRAEQAARQAAEDELRKLREQLCALQPGQ